MFDKIWLIPLMPLIGVLINGLLGSRIEKFNKNIIHWVACGAVFISFVITCIIFIEMLGLEPDQRLYEFTCFNWISSGVLKTYVAYQVDPLSMFMCMFVTGVGFLIHIYSIGYMAHDEGKYYRYFTYLNLFMFSMLNLILANNYLLMFLGWEGVGLCSYLLIGFWFSKEENAIAGKKAFITNRIGDFCFIVGMLMLFCGLGEHGVWSFRFTEVFPSVHLLSPTVITTICLLFFAGCTAKSAQIPLFIWLPDAMAGPTPVSALIHAATMVTSGIYMVARSNILFSLSPTALMVVAWTGALTALLAASIGLVQNDIKKVLAYSTVSQLGYMFLGLGVGAYAAGMFHVLTHAFFKALLFMGAGSVIHAMSGEQDMRNMGGLRTKTPITFWTMAIATIAIVGLPPFAGFFSKDEILWKTFSSGNILLWGVGAVAAGLTAFYMSRLIFMTFFNKCRASDEVKHHIHESPKTMTFPLIILAGLSMIGGFLNVPHALKYIGFLGEEKVHHLLDPVIGLGPGKILQKAGSTHGLSETAHHAAAPHHSMTLEYGLMFLSIAIALTGIYVAYLMYMKNRDWPKKLAARFATIHKIIFNKWYVDEIYAFLFVRPFHALSNFFWKGIDIPIIDGIVNGIPRLIGWSSNVLKYIQSGHVQNYAVSIVLGTLFLLIYYYLRIIP